MNKVVLHPSIPYFEPILTRFRPGKLIRIYGTVSAAANRFNIALQCCNALQDDIAIQITARLPNDSITLNSFQSGVWGEEQSIPSSVIKRTENFEIVLICGFNLYKVLIKQYHFEFPQRIHCDRISHLAIDGDVSVIKISYEYIISNQLVVPSTSRAAAQRISTNNIPQYYREARPGTTENNRIIIPTIRAVSALDVSPPPSYEAVMSGRLGELQPSYAEATSRRSSNTTDNPLFPSSIPLPLRSNTMERTGYSVGNAIRMSNLRNDVNDAASMSLLNGTDVSPRASDSSNSKLGNTMITLVLCILACAPFILLIIKSQ